VSTAALWVGIALLGGAGAVARFLIDLRIERAARTRFPLGTLIVNLTGALVLGVVFAVNLHHDAALLVGSAVLGSYTTFSTWMLESERLGEDGQPGLLALNLALSLTLGLAAAALGRRLGSAL